MFILFLLLGILSCGPHLAFGTLKIAFSEANECEPVFVTFLGQLNSSLQNLPLSLEVLPFNSTPTVIPLPSYATNSSGVNITFLPIASQTQFIATLNDPSGTTVSTVSDIFEISATSPANTACLSGKSFTPSYEIENAANISQCENFTVSFSGGGPPTVELFNPKGISYPLQLVSSTTTTATYIMAAERENQVLLMFNSGAGGQNETSPLLTVQGNAFSPTTCLSTLNNKNSNSKSNSSSNPKKSPSITKGAIIGLSVGIGIVVLLMIPMVWFVIRERRRRRRVAKQFDFDNRIDRTPSVHVPQVVEKVTVAPPPFFGYPGYTEGGYVKDPAYVSEKYSPTISDYPRTSISWEYIPRASSNEEYKHNNSDVRASAQMNMLSSSNIEMMLSRASVDGLATFAPPSRGSSARFLPVSSPSALRHGYRPSPDVPHNLSFSTEGAFVTDNRSMPLFESPESLGSRLRPDSGTISHSSAGAIEGFEIVQPQRAILQQARSVSPRTVSRENSRAKLEGGDPWRVGSTGSRFSMDSSDADFGNRI